MKMINCKAQAAFHTVCPQCPSQWIKAATGGAPKVQLIGAFLIKACRVLEYCCHVPLAAVSLHGVSKAPPLQATFAESHMDNYLLCPVVNIW